MHMPTPRLRQMFPPLFCLLLICATALAQPARKPNVIYIMADDLGYGDLGCYGQKLIRTPALDRMAAEGMRFTQMYAGSTVCAPSRAVLMSGRHAGHVSVRGNAGRENATAQSLRQTDRTIAQVFKDAGYATAMFGKWGLGEIGMEGHPNRKGFDEFFGYLNQAHAHNYFPTWLVRNTTRVPLTNISDNEAPEIGSGWARERKQHSHDVIHAEAMKWLDAHYQQPFFLYLPFTMPHANNEANRGLGDGQEINGYGDYAGKPWKNPDKGQAAMISRLDRDIGALLAKLKTYGIDRNTLVIFTSDNGPHQEGGNDPELFDANGPLRGIKRALFEGGIRVPFIARWPGVIKPGAVSPHIGYFGDVMATIAALTGQSMPAGLDSISFLPTLRGKPAAQKQHEYLYWEFYEQGSRQAVRFGNWKAIRQPMISGQVALYDLAKDIGETNDLAAAHPDLVARAVKYMNEAHVNDARWKVR